MTSLTYKDFDEILEKITPSEDFIKAIVCPVLRTDMVPRGTMMKVQESDGFYLVVNKHDLSSIKRSLQDVTAYEIKREDVRFAMHQHYTGIPVIESDKKYREVVEIVIKKYRDSLMGEMIKPVEVFFNE